MERPIILKAHEVRGILGGRQTQLRRALKPQPHVQWSSPEVLAEAVKLCPFGQVGDRLWGRETWKKLNHANIWTDVNIKYSVDGNTQYFPSHSPLENHPFYQSPILMPRWASRILLEIVSVRVERLLDISDTDAKAEGVEPDQIDITSMNDRKPRFIDGYVCSFLRLWNSVHGKDAASKNPWVWVVEFKRVYAA